MTTADYYDNALFAGAVNLPGTGVIGLITGDHLHPPMVDDAAIWRASGRWRDGCAQCVRRLALNAGLAQADRILDVGCGVGGATRLLRGEFGARAIGLNISEMQIRTARDLNSLDPYVKATVTSLPVRSCSVHCIFCINMFYHVLDPGLALAEMMRVTRSGGTLAFDDWVVTESVTAQDRLTLQRHWNPEPVTWLTDMELERAMTDAGYAIERIDDYSHVGRGVMAEYFAPTFEREVRPLITASDPLYGERVADDLRAAIDHTISLYTDNKMRYLQIIARKP